MSKDYCTPFRVPYSDITGDNNSALFLAQLEYWQGIKGDDWVAKSVTDWWNELRLSKKQVARIKAELESFGYIETCLLFFKGSQTTGYCFKKEAVQKALSEGFNAYDKDTIVPKGHDAKRALSPKVTMPKGNYAPSPKGTMHSTQREPSITENTTENTTDTSFTETSSVVPQLFKSELMQQELQKAIGKNETAKPKSKKTKKEITPLDKEIAEKVKSIVDGFTKWHLETKNEPYLSTKIDFINLTKLFKSLNRTADFTPEQTIEKLRWIFKNYTKLSAFSKNNFSVNFLATKYNVLLSEIDNYKPPVAKQNFNEPVATVVKRDGRETFNGTWLPLGITKDQYLRLSIAIAQDKIMSGDLPEDYSAYRYADYLHTEIKDYTPDQLKTLLEEYDVR